ncbi:MAG: hypothetical protein ACTTKH_03275 [Treponema sp.]
MWKWKLKMLFIFEFKVGAKPIDAITQIKEMGYAEKHMASKKSVFLVLVLTETNVHWVSG